MEISVGDEHRADKTKHGDAAARSIWPNDRRHRRHFHRHCTMPTKAMGISRAKVGENPPSIPWCCEEVKG